MTDVAFMNNYPGASLGGAEVQLLTLLRGLVTAGMRPSVVCARGSALERELRSLAGVDAVPVDFAYHRLPSLVTDLSARLRDVQIVQGTGYLTNQIARWVGGRTAATVVNRVAVIPGAARLDGESRLVSAVRDLVDRWSRRRVARFVAISHAVEAGLVAKGVSASRITVIPIGLDAAQVRRAASASARLAGVQAAARVGFVGRLEPVKGCEFFIRAVVLLATAHPDVRFVIAGTGSQQTALRKLAEKLGVASRIEFLGFQESVLPLLAALDVVVVPSLSEASGNVAIEALALGVPVVASQVGGLPDAVVHEETGLLVKPGDAAGIARAVDRMLKEPDWARGLASAGARRVEEHFAAKAMVDGYLRLYSELAS